MRGKKNDLTGHVFGKLKVISEAGKSNTGHVQWNCICQCGKTTIANGSALLGGKYKSCGCGRLGDDLTGRNYGRLTVIRKDSDRTDRSNAKWVCGCACGNTVVVTDSHLTCGHTTSCGCFRREARTTHGMSSSPEYASWLSMIQRCTNPLNDVYQYYGGRGVTVCDRWLNSFECFYDDMGPRPTQGHSIDRENNDGNYEPGNCRWATPEQQANNKRTNVFYDYGNRKLTLSQISKEVGLNKSLLRGRLDRGWSVDRAVSTPTKK